MNLEDFAVIFIAVLPDHLVFERMAMLLVPGNSFELPQLEL